MGTVDAKVGVRVMERYSEHAFDGMAFCLGSDGGRGQSKSSLEKNKPCDQMAGVKALGLEIGFCLEQWIFQLSNALWAFIGLTLL